MQFVLLGDNKLIISDTQLITCILAEEPHHHFTVIGDTTTKYYSYHDRLMTNKKRSPCPQMDSELHHVLNDIIFSDKKHLVIFMTWLIALI
ncbi:MAG: hypothetical protein ACOYVK_06190 [Bacillota bacterium]